MKFIKIFTVILGILLVSVPCFAQIQSPTPIPLEYEYVGSLSKPNGSPYPNGDYNVEFQICTDELCGNVLWFESHLVMISALNKKDVGLGISYEAQFKVILGIYNPMDFARNQKLYLNVQEETLGHDTTEILYPEIYALYSSEAGFAEEAGSAADASHADYATTAYRAITVESAGIEWGGEPISLPPGSGLEIQGDVQVETLTISTPSAEPQSNPQSGILRVDGNQRLIYDNGTQDAAVITTAMIPNPEPNPFPPPEASNAYIPFWNGYNFLNYGLTREWDEVHEASVISFPSETIITVDEIAGNNIEVNTAEAKVIQMPPYNFILPAFNILHSSLYSDGAFLRFGKPSPNDNVLTEAQYVVTAEDPEVAVAYRDGISYSEIMDVPLLPIYVSGEYAYVGNNMNLAIRTTEEPQTALQIGGAVTLEPFPPGYDMTINGLYTVIWAQEEVIGQPCPSDNVDPDCTDQTTQAVIHLDAAVTNIANVLRLTLRAMPPDPLGSTAGDICAVDDGNGGANLYFFNGTSWKMVQLQ